MSEPPFNKFLIVGFGSSGKRHLRNIQKTFPNSEIKILRHDRQNNNLVLENETIYSIEEAVNFKPEVAIIANPAPFHIGISQQLVEIGTHVLIEKPLSDSLVGIQTLLTTGRERNATIAVAYNLRQMKSLKVFKENIDSDILGKIYSVRCEAGHFLPNWRPNVDYKKTVTANKHLGGGALLELSHEIDYLNWIFGPISWVSAMSAQLSDLDINVEDAVSILFGVDPTENSGAIIGTLSLDLLRQDRSRYCMAIGSNGSIKWDGLKGTVEVYLHEEQVWREIFREDPSDEDSYLDQWRSFIESIKKKCEPTVSGHDGEKVMRIIIAIRDSIKNGRKMPTNNDYEIIGSQT